VTFNDHHGSTKSYAYTRERLQKAVNADLIMERAAITAEYESDETMPIELFDGSTILLKKVGTEYDPTSRPAALGYLERQRALGFVVTGLLFIDDHLPEMHDISKTARIPLKDLQYARLNPGSAALAKIQESMK
jgi:2-oxoglutarate ferredoxin oxidoreductase subunit beta